MPFDVPTCSSVAEQFASIAGGEAVLDPVSAEHVASCLRCQAEQAQYRRLMKVMRELRHAPVPVDPALAHEILFALDARDGRVRSLVWSRVGATIGGVAAGAAAAAGVIVLTVRQRRVARLAS